MNQYVPNNKWTLFVLTILLLSIGCFRNTPPNAEVVSATQTRTTAVPVTAAPSPVSSPVHPTYTPSPLAVVVPTPTMPLPLGPQGYHLKARNIVEELAAFREAYDQILTERLRGDPVQAATIFGKELLWQHPDLHQEIPFLFELAYLQAGDSSFLSVGSSIETLVKAIEIALNADQVQPAQLGNWLAPYGFVIAAYFEADNMFGDGQPAQVLQIEVVRRSETMEWPAHSLVVVLSGQLSGEYRLTPLRHTWLAYNLTSGGGGEEITVADRNGDGRSDIASIVTVFGRATCSSELSLYEWQGDQEFGSFVNIAPIPGLWSGYYHYGCNDVWHFMPSERDGPQAIVRQINYHNPVGQECEGFQSQQVYNWDGTEYIFADKRHVAYDETRPDKCRVGWAYYAPAELAIPVFEPVHNHWQSEYDKWGTASQDLLLFKLATWYAFAGQQTAAQTILEGLIINPPTPQYTLIPRLATAFLAAYQSQADLFPACSAVIQIAQADLEANPRDEDYVGMEAERLEALWGFFDLSWYTFTFLDILCDRSLAFDLSISMLNAANVEELVAWFEEQQIPLIVLADYDFSGNGKTDWLVTSQMDNLWHLYLFIRESDGIVVIRIPVSRLERTPVSSHFETVNLHNSGSAYLLHAGENLVVFEVDDLQADVLLSTWGVTDYTLLHTASKTQIIVERVAGTQEVYTWNHESHLFELPPWTSPEYEQAQAIQEIRQILLDLGDAQTAVILLETLLSGKVIEQGPDHGIALVKPRLLYLLGLAYEMTNREADAIQVYWQLWQDYPDNVYTQLAKAKLELTIP